MMMMMIIIISSIIITKQKEKRENKERVKTRTTFLMPFDITFIKTAEKQDYVPALESFGCETLTILDTQARHYRWGKKPVKRGNEENLSTWKYLFYHVLG